MLRKVYSERSRTKLLTILAVVLFTATGSYALPDKIFTSSGNIFPGEEYSIVRIYNDDTVVNMYGGSSDYITTYDQSTLNFYSGRAQCGGAPYSLREEGTPKMEEISTGAWPVEKIIALLKL